MRMAAGAQYLDEIESHVANTLQVLLRRNAQGLLAMLLLERAALAKLRGNLDGMKRDLVEARRMFAEMGVIGWDDYARSIEA